MKNYRYLLWILVIALYAISCSDSTSTSPPLPDPPDPPDPVEQTIPAIDNEINDFMTRFDVPGLSLAVTKNGRLVYARGYGFADEERAVKVDTSSLFRIASLSKYITSVGIMTLLEEGALSMDDKVFGQGAILGTDFGTQPYPEYIEDITIQDLLHHEAGGWGNSSNDPTFAQPELTVNELISWAVDNRPLTNPPGTAFDYSNLGFQILGRVIEKLSGQHYNEFIQDNVFTPAGVTNMQIAGGTLEERVPNEVKYYGKSGYASPYGYADVFSRLNSAGGWIASAIDLMRIMVRTDGFSTVPDMLNASTIQVMTTPSDLSVYACGLRVNNSDNWWHGGGIAGTRTWMVRTYHGYNWAILMNTRSYDSDFTKAIDRLIWPAVNNPGTDWPDVDLF